MANKFLSEEQIYNLDFLKSNCSLLQKEVDWANAKLTIAQLKLQNFVYSLFIKHGLDETYELTSSGEFIQKNTINNDKENKVNG